MKHATQQRSHVLRHGTEVSVALLMILGGGGSLNRQTAGNPDVGGWDNIAAGKLLQGVHLR